ncbi:hypothetical protein E1B28_002706 [Marasmius oreades]|uniref:Uncharacterized protein n=1 Tax=Marasmius oreades TaxID=181124 RepID=A0A9P7UNC8_9AGAR|nr:uncharacterized protein E1B28_002706 [Marasmius oreades]KAG7086776.1 hypothetical protein E1B28_002706 [Marasmius oreades]
MRTMNFFLSIMILDPDANCAKLTAFSQQQVQTVQFARLLTTSTGFLKLICNQDILPGSYDSVEHENLSCWHLAVIVNSLLAHHSVEVVSILSSNGESLHHDTPQIHPVPIQLSAHLGHPYPTSHYYPQLAHSCLSPGQSKNPVVLATANSIHGHIDSPGRCRLWSSRSRYAWRTCARKQKKLSAVRSTGSCD